MTAEPRTCPYCGMSMAADQRNCPDCGNPYPFDDESMPPPRSGPLRPQRPAAYPGGADEPFGPSAQPPVGRATRAPGTPSGSSGSSLLALAAQYRTALVLVAVLLLIVVVGYVLFTVVMSFFGERRPDPSVATPAAGPVIVPTLGGSPVPATSPSPGTGTMISPAASPSPAAAVRMKVANTEGQGANLRQRPSTTAPVLRTLAEGTVVEVIGNETTAEERTWRNVRDPAGTQTGWVASELLAPE
jgi:hypothetical protein